MPSLPIYVAAGYVDFLYSSESIQEGRPTEITWDSFQESEIIDRNWNEWTGTTWDGSGVLLTFNIVARAVGGYLAFGTSTQSVNFTQPATTMNRLRDQTAPFTFTTLASLSGLGGFLASAEADLTTAFTQPATLQNRLRDQENPFIYNAVTSSEQNANVTFGPSPSLTAVFSQLSNLNYVLAQFQPKTLQALFSELTNLTYILAQLQPTTLQAFAFEITEGNLISLVDPFFTIKALQEFRTFVVPRDSRIIECLAETRVNTASTETRRIQVLQETRKNFIKTPAFKNRSSIPRTRGDF